MKSNEDFRHFPRCLGEGTQQFMVMVLIPLIFMIQKPESVGINCLVRREKRREREFILKIIVMPTEHPPQPTQQPVGNRARSPFPPSACLEASSHIFH